MHNRTHNHLTFHLQTDAKITVFLFLLVVAGCVLPSNRLETNNLPLYADIVFSVVLILGSAIAWEKRTVFVATSIVVLVLRLRFAGCHGGRQPGPFYSGVNRQDWWLLQQLRLYCFGRSFAQVTLQCSESKVRSRHIYALVSPGHMPIISWHYWIRAPLLPQVSICLTRAAGQTIASVCSQHLVTNASFRFTQSRIPLALSRR